MSERGTVIHKIDLEVERCREAAYKSMRINDCWILEELPSGEMKVHQHSHNGVAPQSTYPTRRKAASRLLQLLGIGPVAPQDYPEKVCIGEINSEQRNTDTAP